MTHDVFYDDPEPCGLPAVALAVTLAACAVAGAVITVVAHHLFGRKP